MTVIAMTREMGSLGRDVALQLAGDLGLELVQHQMVEHVADKMHLQESSVNRFLEGKAGLLERWGINKNELSHYTHEEILDVAARDNVLIRGWGATYVLRNVPHVLCVRICASEASRSDVLMDRIALTDRDVARKEIRANDAAHTRTMSHLFHVGDWGDPLLFDIVLNTDQLSVASCVETLKATLQQSVFTANAASQSLLEDMRIEARIQAALRSNAVTSQSNPSFEVDLEPGTGRVVLSGVVFDDRFSNTAEQLIANVPGVTAVDNQARILSHLAIGP
ncbi:MAG: cytidylate kinase [Gammaproteobacteria bacterium]|jgi:cytidylate kinase